MAQRSMYELLNGANSAGNPDLALNAANSDAVVAKHRFVYNGTGKTVDTNVWTSRSIENADGSTVMGNNGLEIRSHTNSNISRWGIDFNNKQQFDAASCVMIASVVVPENNCAGNGGFGDDPTNHSQPNWVSLQNNTAGTNMTFQSSGSPATGDYYQFANTGVKTTNQPYTYKIESGLSAQKCSISGRLVVTTTVSIQSGVNLEPFFKIYKPSGTTDVKKFIIRYVEAYNA